MGAVLWASMLVIGPFLGMPGLRYIALIVLISIGAVSYFATGQAVGAFRLSEFKSALRKRR
jgi:putative peptidoglycan lipid II flippase